MLHRLPIAPAPFSRRGACPSLDTPMQTGDGLLARLRVANGWLTPAQLGAIAALAREHGNGLVEITARGNLQVRGLREQSASPFAAAIEAIVAIERGLVVETQPLAGDDPQEIADPRFVAQTIREMAGPLADRLGPKVSVVVDGGGQISLAAKADIRLTAVMPGQWLVGVAGAEGDTLPEAEAIQRAGAVLSQLAALGPQSRAANLIVAAPTKATPQRAAPVGSFTLREGSAMGIALPFGSMPAAAIQELCRNAEADGVSKFCLAPQHAILAVGASPSFAARAQAFGFVTTQSDPILRVSACAGSEGCASGFIPARTIAARLAPLVRPGTYLHVSGCTKGCARPRPADTTFVGRPDGLGLVIDGSAGDSPRALLQADELESALAPR